MGRVKEVKEVKSKLTWNGTEIHELVEMDTLGHNYTVLGVERVGNEAKVSGKSLGNFRGGEGNIVVGGLNGRVYMDKEMPEVNASSKCLG